MPEYCRRCTVCEHRFTLIVSSKEIAGVRCPACEGAVDIDFAAQGVPRVAGDELHGTRRESMEFMASPEEVPELRRMYGDVGHMWGDDGRVRGTGKCDFAKFIHKDAELKRINRDVQAAATETTAKTGEPVPTSAA